MSILNKTAINPKLINQIKGESNRDYMMLIDYCNHRNVNKLKDKYKIQLRQIYNIKEKYSWNQRINQLEKKCTNIFIAENFSKLHFYNIQKRDNLLKLSISLQSQIAKYIIDMEIAPISNQENYQPTQQEIAKSLRLKAKAMLEMQKLVQTVDEQLKKFQIDTTPEVLSNFEKDVILSEAMLNYFDDNVEDFDFDSIETTENTVLETSSPIKLDSSLQAEGVSEPKTQVNTLNEAPFPLTQIQNFIDESKKHLMELGIDTSLIEDLS